MGGLKDLYLIYIWQYRRYISQERSGKLLLLLTRVTTELNSSVKEKQSWTRCAQAKGFSLWYPNESIQRWEESLDERQRASNGSNPCRLRKNIVLVCLYLARHIFSAITHYWLSDQFNKAKCEASTYCIWSETCGRVGYDLPLLVGSVC